MTFARNLLHVLVKKHLWPVALLLVVALVAIPVLGGGGGAGADAEQDVLPIAPTNAVSTKPAVDLVGPASVRSRPGRLVDPFRRPAGKKDGILPPGPTPPGGGGTPEGGAPGGGAPEGESAPPEGGTPDPPARSDPAPPRSAPSVYRTTVRWSSNARPKDRRISRLTPLGGRTNPALQYLGVAANGKHALFLLGPDATSTGEAGCPDLECRVIALASGESQIVDLQPAGAEPMQFELQVVSVKREELSSAAVAAREHAKEHPDGRDLLRLLLEHGPTADIMGKYAYDRAEGVMVRAGDETAK